MLPKPNDDKFGMMKEAWEDKPCLNWSYQSQQLLRCGSRWMGHASWKSTLTIIHLSVCRRKKKKVPTLASNK